LHPCKLFPARGNDETTFSGWSNQLCEIDPWTLHDLRRTFATQLASLGTQPHIVERLLNHASGRISGVAAVYNRYQYMDEMRAALERWESKLTRLLQSATFPPAPRAKLVSGRADPIYGSLANDDLARELL
jgi:Phage integrase family